MNTIHGYNEVHITYDLTKMLRSIKRGEKREEEENELRSRINAYRSHRAERKAMKILWVMQKSIGLIMAIMAYIEPSCAIIAAPLACAFLLTKKILPIRPVIIDAEDGVVEFELEKKIGG